MHLKEHNNIPPILYVGQKKKSSLRIFNEKIIINHKINASHVCKKELSFDIIMTEFVLGMLVDFLYCVTHNK